ncbi:nucleobase:cation symporter-2 family protein [Corynebacterium pacaense]|uniref:nucleobase:cation symporter-2 family protein n=1 Tax=Corynebacterium pacaense TaxID=1816684 RepID=UPI0009BB003D|nr:nucleobase:cation symporter-2 family protein [Corynebacterium pacaense]
MSPHPTPQLSPTDASDVSPVHPVDQRPPALKLFLLGLQHVLAMYAGAVAVPLIVGGAMNQAGQLRPEDLAHLIVADLFICGIASIIQSVGLWRFGARLPLVQGVSFVAVAPMISIGSQYGITAIYGSVIVTGLAMMLLAPFFAQIIRYFPPLVTGTIITTIGLSLTSVAANWIRNTSVPESEQGAPMNFLLAGSTLVVVLLVHRFAPPQWRPMAVLSGIIGGTILAQVLGQTDWSRIATAEWVGVPRPFQFGLPQFEVAAIVTMLIVGLVIMTETASDLVAVGQIVDRPVDRRGLADGLRADGLATFLGGVFNTFPYSAYAQNVGLVSLSRVRSRYIVTAAGVMLAFLGLLPKLGSVIACIPSPVLGGAGIALFGMVTVSGIRTLSTIKIDETRALIIAVSITVALLPSVSPTLYDNIPEAIGMLAHSGIASGAICVILLNLLLNRKNNGHLADPVIGNGHVQRGETARDGRAEPASLPDAEPARR